MRVSLPISLDRKAWLTLVGAFVLGMIITLAAMTLTRAAGNGDVVAVVNGEPITREAFFDRLERDAGDRVLEQLITELLVFQAEATYDVPVAESEIDEHIEALRDSYPSEEAFQADLDRYNLTLERLREELHLNLILQKIGTKDVAITDEEIAAYFEENQARLGRPEQIRVRHILVDTEEEAAEIAKELADGADFAELARARSTDTASARQGGDIGYIQKDSPIVPSFKEAAFNLEVGRVSEPVRSDFGWHLILVDERLEAEEATLESSRERIVEILTAERARPVGEILEELIGAARIEIEWPQYEGLERSPQAE